jgi:anaerobic selenocysteine-containing dehydrogenase
VPGDSFYFPHFEPSAEQATTAEYPFRVIFFDPLAAISRQAMLPLVREMAGGHIQNNVGVWVELGRKDAGRLGIRSGDVVWVESPRNKIRAFARISTSTAAGFVNIPRGVAAGSTDPWTASLAPTASILASGAKTEPVAQWAETRVRITRA